MRVLWKFLVDQTNIILLKETTGVSEINLNTVRIHHEREDGNEKSLPRITDGHHEAGRVKQMVIAKDGFFYPTFTRIMDYFPCSPLFLFSNKLPKAPEYAKMQLHMMTSLKHNNDVT